VVTAISFDHPSPTVEAQARPLILLPPELDRAFRLIVFDWDGTAVVSRTSDASAAARALDRVLAAGARAVIVTGTSFTNVARQLDGHISPESSRRLYVSTNRGSELFGFDWRGRAALLWRRAATSEEERGLDRVADEVKGRLERLTGLTIEVVRDRLNRRKIDLIPEPAWRDPPKSALAELLAATEARLRGAGLRNGVREAFELTRQIARDFGLESARITSDVKHIEVGLTDKSDAMARVMRTLARPLQIAAEDVLIAGDELGPIAGYEGSDSLMLTVPEASGATVVSVGPEPGGAPPGVLHVGGGPLRFVAILEHQLEIAALGGAFALPHDAAWLVDEPGFDPAREHEIESRLAIADGYVGARGSIAEGSSVSRPATFLAGAFELSGDPSPVPELLIMPSLGLLRFVIEGEPFAVETSETQHHRRVLDMRRGLLLRDCTAKGSQGHVTRLRTVQAASLADRHLFIEGVEITPLNFTGSIRVDAILSGEVKSASGAHHWESFDASAWPRGAVLTGRTRSGLVAALASHIETEAEGGGAVPVEREIGKGWAAERCLLPVRVAETHALHRTVALFTSRDVEAPKEAARARCVELARRPIAEQLSRHAAAWGERWRRADVTIDGAPGLERALRFGLYHLLAAANPEDPRCSVGARALTGEAYRGHVFWDTEIFMLPFFAHAYPEAARAMLGYRYNTLPGAQRKAAALGYEGALYAWESADTGDETTPPFVVTPFGEVIRVLCGELEHHISADVAFAIEAYARVTADDELLRGPGLAILIATARFWASRVKHGADGLFHIDRVIGPDEYHEEVDDNAFTNWMARRNLRAALAAIARFGAGELGVDAAELARFRHVAEGLYTGYDPETGLIEQFAGFSRLEHIDIAALGPRHAPLDVILGRARTQASQVVKQADVVQLLAQLWDEVAPEVRRACFLYYEPRTGHGSSLSPGVHALVAARLGLVDTAERYLEQTAEIDLGNSMGNSAGGVHAAAMGSLWQAVILGVGGVRPAPDHDEAILIEPRLLPTWRHVGFPLSWRGRQLEIHLEPGGVEIAIEGRTPLPVRVASAGGVPREVLAEPGLRYAARRGDAGFGPWEEIRS
jgi:trehalose/maltose hydrolase-like predicted phosphorylase/phosphoglycolate phosphatase-like HAD superfamily hydrolase